MSERGLLLVDHEYEGLNTSYFEFGHEGHDVPRNDWVAHSDSWFEYHDPTTAITAHEERFVPGFFRHYSPPIAAGPECAGDAFCRLPPELIGLVLSYLPSRDVRKLRLVSRVIASVSAPNSLSLEFWRSRFAADMGMGWASSPVKSWLGSAVDWRRLYVAAEDPDRDPPLRNLVRIFECLHYICETLEPLLEATANMSSEDFPPWTSSIVEVGKWRGPTLRCRHSHLFSNQELRLPLFTPVQLSLRIIVSFIRFNCNDYISGIEVWQDPGENETTSKVGASLGARIAGRDEHFDIYPGDSLESLVVFTTPRNECRSDCILGIEFRHRTKGSLTPTPRSFGVHSGPHVELVPLPGEVVHGIAVGFDVRHLHYLDGMRQSS